MYKYRGQRFHAGILGQFQLWALMFKNLECVEEIQPRWKTKHFMEVPSGISRNTWRRLGRNKWRNKETHFCIFLSRTPPNSQISCILLLIGCTERERVTVMLSVLPHSTFNAQILYKMYSVQLNCTYSNYTETAATCSAAQQHSTFTVQILYKLYSVQPNCTYSNYTETAATCSAAQQHSTFTVQILYKLYSLQLNCTYSNYTEVAATCSAVQQHSTFTVQTVQSATVQTVQSATELYLQ